MAAHNTEYILNFVRSFLEGGSEEQGTAKLSEADRKLALAFFECAKRDMRASKLLYKERDYPNAIYHLQQATEKLVKAHFMSVPLFNYNEIRQISHSTPMAFLQLLSKKQMKSFISQLKDVFPLDMSPLDRISDITKTIKRTSTQVGIARLNEEEIKGFLKIMDSISPAKNESNFEAILRNRGMTIDEVEKVAQEMLQNDNIPQQTYNGLDLKGLIRDRADKLMKSFYSSVILYVLAVITFPHERFTRYPDGEIKPEEYTKSLGIVAQFEAIIHKLENVSKYAESELLSDSSRSSGPKPKGDVSGTAQM